MNQKNQAMTPRTVSTVDHFMQVSVLLPLFFLLLNLEGLAQRPNIIYIMTDDMGYGDLSCYGQVNYTTPNLDKLASQGIKFLNAYAAAPVCTPTRAASP